MDTTASAQSDFLKVVIADDDPAILRLLSVWLGNEGYQVRTAGNGEEALDLIDADCPHFLITDWEMPGMNGLELCRRVRELNLPHYVYIMFLTVKSGQDEFVEGMDVGADEFIIKPVHRFSFLAQLRAGRRVLQL